MRSALLSILLGALLWSCTPLGGTGAGEQAPATAPSRVEAVDAARTNPAQVPSADRFGLALDRFLGGDAGALQELAASEDGGHWGRRARHTLERFRQQEAGCRTRLREREQSLAACETARQRALQEQAATEADLQKLKRILIDLESR